jgi:hypothetical protein
MTFDDRLSADAVRALVERHGFWRVLCALTAAALWRRAEARVAQVADLSDHLRRDIGLPPRGRGAADWSVRPSRE